MNYSEIVSTALAYADRADNTYVSSNIDNFLRIVESRVNRSLRTAKQTKRAQIVTSADTYFYALPTDFAGLRNAESVIETQRGNYEYVTPEKINVHITNNLSEKVYTIIGRSLQICPPLDDTILEINYYQRIIPLDSTNDTNWLSEYAPDAYIQGLLVEINSFVKDADASSLWDARFNLTVAELDLEDAKDRWSGPPPMIRIS
jgi:hypothetical protein